MQWISRWNQTCEVLFHLDKRFTVISLCAVMEFNMAVCLASFFCCSRICLASRSATALAILSSSLLVCSCFSAANFSIMVSLCLWSSLKQTETRTTSAEKASKKKFFHSFRVPTLSDHRPLWSIVEILFRWNHFEEIAWQTSISISSISLN